MQSASHIQQTALKNLCSYTNKLLTWENTTQPFSYSQTVKSADMSDLYTVDFGVGVMMGQ